MKGDFSRVTYNRQKNYSQVLMQQGRVLLDADWNEQTAIFQETMRLLSRDIFGAHGGPAIEMGSRIETGFRVFHRSNITTGENEALKALRAAEGQTRGDELEKARQNGDLIIGSGRYYVDGHIVENYRAELYSKQAGYPFDPEVGIGSFGASWLAYLDVWEEFVSYIQDDHLLDKALGGPDTCGRSQTKWQVRVINEASDEHAVDDKQSTGTGRLLAQAQPKAKSDELCVVAPDARYQGLENQLYRVEIHRGDKSGTALYKWSRDNGALAYPIVAAAGARIELAHLGKDKVTGLVVGSCVEYIDDQLLARSGSGMLARVDKLDRNENAVMLELPNGTTTTPVFKEEYHPLLRRWDHVGNFSDGQGAIIIKKGDWLNLENGIQIKFISDGGTYRTGDYWLIPARVAPTGEIEWPEDGAPKLPDGPRHSYAPLLFVDANGPKDCRFACKFERKPMP